MDSRRYIKLRENAMKSLENAIRESRVDSDILPLLNKINSIPSLFTTSSCSGRIVIIEVPYPGAKPGANFLGKWHRTIKKEEIYGAIERSHTGYIWFMFHPPILHVVAENRESAERLVKMALSSGFKNSGMRAFRGKIVVEIRSTERMDVLIGKDGKMMVGDDYISILCEVANMMLEKGKKKLNVLIENIEKFMLKKSNV